MVLRIGSHTWSYVRLSDADADALRPRRHRYALHGIYSCERDGGVRLSAKALRHRVLWGSSIANQMSYPQAISPRKKG